MEPVSACHQLLLCLQVWLPNCGALVVYDRQSLFNIRLSFFLLLQVGYGECVFNKPYGSVTTDIPECIRRWPVSNPRMIHRRKCGSDWTWYSGLNIPLISTVILRTMFFHRGLIFLILQFLIICSLTTGLFYFPCLFPVFFKYLLKRHLCPKVYSPQFSEILVSGLLSPDLIYSRTPR